MALQQVFSFEGTVSGELGGIVGENTPEDTNTSALCEAFQVETPSVFIGGGRVGIVQRLYIEADTQGIAVTPSVIIDNTTYVLSSFSTTSKAAVEKAINRTGFIASVRLDVAEGLMTNRIEISAIELDIYGPAV